MKLLEKMNASSFLLAAACAALWMPWVATAQPSDGGPDAQQIIDALKPQAPAPRTRSLRNLVVREKSESQPQAASAAASGVASAQAVTLRPEPLPEPEPPPSLSMAIQFDFDSARLRPQGESALDRLAAALKSPELAASRFLVEGHTDAKGSAAYNLRLSQSRAAEVRRYLVAQGVPPDRVESVGRGSQEPVNAANPYAAENRRVRIVNIDGARKP